MKKVHISPMTILSLFIFCLCICGIVVCIVKTNAYHHAQPLSDLAEDSLKPNKYVSGTITSYVVSPLDKRTTADGDSYFGNLLDIWGRPEYRGYLIPFNEEQYIKIWMKDEESLALLRETPDGSCVNVPFTGRMEKVEIPSGYTDEQLGFDHNKVITEYVIFQKNLSSEMFWIKICLVGILISLPLYWFKGRIEVSETVYEDRIAQSQISPSVPGYSDISDEIVIVERRIKMHEKRAKEYRTWGCIGAVCVIVGVFVFVRFGSFPALVTLFLLAGYGLSQLQKWFINSGNGLAVFLAHLFNLSTLWAKQKEDHALLADLRKSLSHDIHRHE
ncbi:MAG: hypothetical protein NC398_06990 [Acetatifactor muris]|nr:hypothetical protein [Acetatifactor muris]MCM1525682.1 hypothetical protein [Bacteroides sp.]